MCDRDEEDEATEDAPDAQADEGLGEEGEGDAIAEIQQDEEGAEVESAAGEHASAGKTHSAASNKTMCVFLFILSEYVEWCFSGLHLRSYQLNFASCVLVAGPL